MATTHRSDLIEQLEKALTDEAYDGGMGPLSPEQFTGLVRTLASTAAAVIEKAHTPTDDERDLAVVVLPDVDWGRFPHLDTEEKRRAYVYALAAMESGGMISPIPPSPQPGSVALTPVRLPEGYEPHFTVPKAGTYLVDAEGATLLEAHDCDACTDCLHNGRRCCGCYDGVCCQEPQGEPSDPPSLITRVEWLRQSVEHERLDVLFDQEVARTARLALLDDVIAALRAAGGAR